MVIKIYLMLGIIFEIWVILNYLKNNVSYTNFEILIGAIIDVLVWPILLFVNLESFKDKES